MKFLCVPCDSPMTLRTVGPPDRGSLSIVYSCPECGYEIAMLTNAMETQMVESLGVRIGPASGADAAASVDGQQAASRCPFSAMIPATDGPLAAPGQAASAAAGQPAAVRWTAAAEARLEKVPSFVRPMARAGIEQFARDHGTLEVDEGILDAARDFFGM